MREACIGQGARASIVDRGIVTACRRLEHQYGRNRRDRLTYTCPQTPLDDLLIYHPGIRDILEILLSRECDSTEPSHELVVRAYTVVEILRGVPLISFLHDHSQGGGVGWNLLYGYR